MIRRLNARLTGFSLNSHLLENYEKGTVTEERRRALDKAILEEFPECVPKTPKKKKKSGKLGAKPFAYAFLFLAFAAILVGFFKFNNNDLWETFEESLGLIATVLSIIAFILGIRWFKN